jgi:pimeloyl-ACP methyl ester carboxylesterase
MNTTNNLIYRTLAAQAECEEICAAALAEWPVPYESVHVPTRFGQVYAVVSGPPEAPPLVLLPGNWATATMWSNCVARLSETHRTVVVDILGDLGRSEPTRLPAARQDHAAWLGNVLDALHLDTAAFVGLSYGGDLTVGIALDSPTRVTRLALLHPGLPLPAPPTRQWAIYGAPMILFRAEWAVRWFVRGASAPSPNTCGSIRCN